MSAAIPPTDVPLPDKDDVQSWANNARVSIVPLKGAEDYDEWFVSIEMQARILGLSKHFSGETPHSDDTDKYHAVLTSIVRQSLSQRMQRNLTHAGWNSRLPITRMMNFIKVDCGFEADIAIIELLARFSESNRSNFSTTRAWLDHHQDLWARINKIEPISDKVWISQTVQAVKDAFPQLHSSWRIKGFSKDLLHKSEMLQYLNYEANRPQDEQKIGFTTQRKRSRSSSKKPKSKKNNLSHDITLDCGCVINDQAQSTNPSS
ncbi:hypothetical protein E4U51_005946 [Claviceps purpurea]|nr:hypothetical protein E4U51_005946 [Claviceps purpurea]